PDLMANVQIWSDAEFAQKVAEAQAEEVVKGSRQAANPAYLRAANIQLESAKSLRPAAEQIRSDWMDLQLWLFIAMMAGFMVKVPVWPFHTWMPRAYGEAPIGVMILLSALLAKLGTYGILRFVLPLLPDAALAYGLPAVGTLAAFGIIYGGLCA